MNKILKEKDYPKGLKILIKKVRKELKEENATYGELIIQTNKVQQALIKIIGDRIFTIEKNTISHLEEKEFGPLIYYFRITAKDKYDLSIVKMLFKYKTFRNKLAHKMYTNKRLTTKECEKAIKLGNKILKKIVKFIPPMPEFKD